MKKILLFCSMSLMLFFGSVAFTSCGDDGDGSDDPIVDEGAKPADPIMSIPTGYYALEYECDGKKLYGGVDYSLYTSTRDAAAAGDVGFFTNEIFKKYEGYAQHLGLYVFLYKGNRYLAPITHMMRRSMTNETYDSRTYNYPGGSVTVYLELVGLTLDEVDLLTPELGYSYSDGFLIYGSSSRYKRLDYAKRIDWIDESCIKLIEKNEY